MTADYHLIVVAQSGQAARELFLPKHVGSAWQAHLPPNIPERTADVGAPVLATVQIASYTEADIATRAARAAFAAKPDDPFAQRVVRSCDEIAELLAWSGGAGFANAWVILWSTDID